MSDCQSLNYFRKKSNRYKHLKVTIQPSTMYSKLNKERVQNVKTFHNSNVKTCSFIAVSLAEVPFLKSHFIMDFMTVHLCH